ncbi:hypothetical protein COEREDRAFT_82495 [Coemansia reversa NRRL 1564]|uniref:Uncharacterized protein n=1 Tax=Coemansia reversa (strain ATCC 12441 / NRRL 1564) TaxID=763665 RepID=A0A2G5B6U4_COERN|nr:hypothetical protein COEREDRAFT_82495 [Coemansia reversa NRRL 1564]|eukprot:PIA14735.1 hypothetical protein COEREDRAFT_82495 [Coemansia reversa NRRL 1564]
MPSIRVYAALAFGAASVVTAVPANVRREEATTSYLGYIVSQVAGLLGGAGDEKYASVVLEAANSIVGADGQQNDDVDAQQVIKSMLEKLDDSNDSSSAAGLASTILQLINEDTVPTEAANLVDEIGSELEDSKENTNIATVVSNLIEFVADLRSAVPTLFEDAPETDENTSTSNSSEEEESNESSNKDDDESSDTGTNSANRSFITLGSLSMGIAVSVLSSMF